MANYMSRFKSTIWRNLINIPGWKTNRKIVVIESDDWGTIRMPSKEVYLEFISKGFDISGSYYNRLDTLESNDDLLVLYDVLLSHKDSMGNFPVITANCVIANPDFHRIRQSDFSEYFFEPVTETLNRYPGRDKVEVYWKQGNAAGIFHPQFHGREHLNVIRWMEALQKRTPEIMYTFDRETTYSGNGDYNYMEALDYNTPDDLVKMKEILAEGMDLFEMIFGYKSKSFIPPCYTWNSEVEELLNRKGVRYIQGLVIQFLPTGSYGNYKKKYNFMGKRNSYGQYFLIRNCFFEPSLLRRSDPVGECLSRISNAFIWKKPAVIGTHRINFMGSLDVKNRSDNIKLFRELLSAIIKKWPNVEFMTSDQLGDLIAGEVQYDEEIIE